MNVVVVEDESIIAISLEIALKDFGCVVMNVSAEANEGIKAIFKYRPDFLILDVKLRGEKDGMTLFEEIEDLALPTIFVTAYRDELYRWLGFRRPSQRVAVLQKPFSFEDVKFALQAIHVPVSKKIGPKREIS